MHGELTGWIQRMGQGDAAALEKVVQLLYDELRGIARQRLRNERSGHTLSATALVNEAYLRLAHHEKLPSESRTQFLAAASNTMRRVLVDYARARLRHKRGGAAEHISLDEAEPFISEAEADEILALEDALERLSRANPRAAEVVQHRFFSGLTVDEIASHLALSSKTVQRDWIAARAWLRKEVIRGLALPE
ncbi:MAG: sigma-70 family RNA polymerase sigma factor [Candidatus Eisenbacteria bacterium]|uniref:Sigma-70 family RNA polymerase sigma factor n=1 Tax=Eiseniibacteriota bacterium TaxID=2212470 RepID=A0A849SUI5_UNCEI|nr:sigma-70 family RNA polymerase sigma factor [Candidatus Eisenbacteria bacterium]